MRILKPRSSALRLLLGALLGGVPMAVTLLLPPSQRFPYIFAFPAVILSAWLWETAGSAMTALTAGVLIEHFIFATREINFSPGPEGTYLREGTFVLGSILAGTLTRQTAREKDRQAQLATERHAALLSAEERIATSEGVFRDLEKENAVRTELALEGADLGLWEWNLQTNQSRWSQSFYRLHGLTLHQGAAYDLWRSLVDPADVERVELEIQAAIGEDRSFTSEYRVMRRDERDPERWLLLGGKQFEANRTFPSRWRGTA